MSSPIFEQPDAEKRREEELREDERLGAALRRAQDAEDRLAALAQSDAGPPPLRYSDKVERAGDGTETRRLELAQSDEGPVATDAMIKAAASVLANVDGYDLNVDVNWRDNYERIAHNMLEAALTVPAPPTASAGLAKEIEELKRENKVLRAITRGAQKADGSGLIEAAEWPYGYQDTFNLISDATGLVGGNIGISVSKFEKAYNKLRARAADRNGISEK